MTRWSFANAGTCPAHEELSQVQPCTNTIVGPAPADDEWMSIPSTDAADSGSANKPASIKTNSRRMEISVASDSELRVVVRRDRLDGLHGVPVLDDAAGAIEPEDVHRSVAEITGRSGRDVGVGHDEIALRDRAHDLERGGRERCP